MDEDTRTTIAVLDVVETVEDAGAAAGRDAKDTAQSCENARVVAKFYEAYAARDVDAAAQLAAPDFVLHVPGRGVLAGEHWGTDGFRRYLSIIQAHSGAVFDFRVTAIAVNGEHVFTREVLELTRAGEPDSRFVLRISNWFKLRGSLLSEAWVIPEHQRAYDAYWSSAKSASGAAAMSTPRERYGGVDLERAASTKPRALLERMYDRFWRGDAAAMRETVDDDVVVNIVGESAMSGVYRGWDGYMEFRRRLMSMAASKYKLDVVALAAGGRDVFAVEYIRMNRSWDPTLQEIYVLMHFEVDDGRVTRMDDFPFDTYAWEQFYTPDARWEG
ncbi:protein of unknown function DUF1486 (plasmid) [Gemmatirosa kalamazoonensis]|uniref:SnoaL-like domain-containing protein n=1 Tax=Gemmatirosa kalamazoonensis TaxID=861299 RepID=W0RUJ7_9BACT|nr:nuclear transport factor 2 family protein [Gemmatirosa kalamazoonensis]AHG93228.1 protein of unknown function DUF1486 [Gemmatirosa kalamazoonensis]